MITAEIIAQIRKLHFDGISPEMWVDVDAINKKFLADMMWLCDELEKAQKVVERVRDLSSVDITEHWRAWLLEPVDTQ